MAAREEFVKESTLNAFNFNSIDALKENLSRYSSAFEGGREQYKNLLLARNRAAFARWKAIENLDKYLLEFETNSTRRGIKVIWAPEKKDAQYEINEILKRHKVKNVVKSKSSVCEEIGVSKFLTESGYSINETDVADVVLSRAGEKPSHIITPIIHKTQDQVAALLTSAGITQPEDDIEKSVHGIADNTRNKYFAADAGITGCNFLIADTGSIALTENEGNIIFSSGLPKIHIVIAGLDKVLPSMADLDTLWPLLSTYGTGQKITAYNTIINGAKSGKEIDGPEEVYVVLLDNGRTELLAKKEQRLALTCIKCGACANVCPVFKTIGGQAYGVNNPGPVGAVMQPHTHNFKEYEHLSEASTLCGKCTQACPVNIDLHNMLVENRKDALDMGLSATFDNYLWLLLKKAMLNRKWMNRGDTFKGLIIKSSYRKNWGEKRDFPTLSKQSFNQLWREKFNVK